MLTTRFWKATAERAVKSFAQSLLALLSAGSVGLLQVNWMVSLSTAGMAGLLSVLSSVGSSRIGDGDDPTALPAPSRAAEPVAA
jgi:hypothetical protein